MTPSVRDSSSVSAFLLKLWNMVDDSSTDNLISWSDQGDSFMIHNQIEFAQSILPSYYKHNNISSFIRQLNMYGFRKHVNPTAGCLKADSGALEFSHSCFQRKRPELLSLIKRKMGPAEKVNIPNDNSNSDIVLHDVLTEVRNLRELQDFTKSQVCNMQRENEILWREVAILRQKQTSQQHIMNRLIRFLITLARNPGTNSNRRRFLPLMIKDNSTFNHAFNSQNFNTDRNNILSPSGPTILELDASDMLEVQMNSPIANVISSPRIATNHSDNESIASSPLSYISDKDAADRQSPHPELTVVPTKLLVPVTLKDQNTSRKGLLLPTGQLKRNVIPDAEKSNQFEINHDTPSSPTITTRNTKPPTAGSQMENNIRVPPAATQFKLLPGPPSAKAQAKVNLGSHSTPTQIKTNIAPSSSNLARMKLKYEPPPATVNVSYPIERKQPINAPIETNASDRVYLAPTKNQSQNYAKRLNANFKRLLTNGGEGPSGIEMSQKTKRLPEVEGLEVGPLPVHGEIEINAPIETNASDRAYLAPTNNQTQNYSKRLNANFKRLINSDGEGPSGIKMSQKTKRFPDLEELEVGPVRSQNEIILESASNDLLKSSKPNDYVVINGKTYKVKKLYNADSRVKPTNLASICASGVDTTQLKSLLVEEEDERQRKSPCVASRGEDDTFSWGLLEEPQYSPMADDYQMSEDQSVLEDMRDKLNAIEYTAVQNDMRRANRELIPPRKRKSTNVRKLVRKSRRTAVEENPQIANDSIEPDEFILGIDDLNGLTMEQAQEVESILRNRPTTAGPLSPYTAKQLEEYQQLSAAGNYKTIDAQNAEDDASGDDTSLGANLVNEVPFENQSVFQSNSKGYRDRNKMTNLSEGPTSNVPLQAVSAENENPANDLEIQSFGTIEDDLNEILRNMGSAESYDQMLSHMDLDDRDTMTRTPQTNDRKFNDADLSLARYENGNFGNFSNDMTALDSDTLNQADAIASELETLKKCMENEGRGLNIQALWGIMNQNPLNYNFLTNPDQNKQHVKGNELVSVNGRSGSNDNLDLSDFVGSSFDWNILSPNPKNSFTGDPGYPELNTPVCERTPVNEFIANPTQDANLYNVESNITR